jgi:Rhodopirellula transposase DDE domain
MTLAGGKTRTDAAGNVTKGGDHDPPAQEKLVPFGIVRVASGALTLLFGSRETSDAWVAAWQVWWRPVRAGLGPVKRRVIALDKGPKNSGRRTPFVKRMVPLADWSGLEIRRVSDPPYQSKSNRIERCWQALEKKGNGVLLNGGKVVRQCALRLTWKGLPPTVKRLHGVDPDGVRVAAKERKEYEARLQRSETLPKYDMIIKPRMTEPQVK